MSVSARHYGADANELVRSGDDLRRRGDLVNAETLLRQAALLAEAGSADRDLANALNVLGMLCKELARHDEASALYQRALAVLEGSSTRKDDDIAALYHNLGGIEHARGDFAAAEPLARRGLAIRRSLGDEDAVAADLVALAAILDGQQKFDEAERIYHEALTVLDRSPEQNAGDIAVVLNNLGAQYVARGRPADALLLLTRAERLKRRCLPERHPDVAVTLNNLAEAHRREGHLAAAEQLYRQAIGIFETTLGAEHPKTKACRRNLSPLEHSTMSTSNESQGQQATVRIQLTAEQKSVVKTAIDRDADAIELTVEELESRIAPTGVTPADPGFFRLAGNHNETFLKSDS